MPVQAASRRPRLHLVPPASQLDLVSALPVLLGPIGDRTVLLVGADTLELICWLMRAGSAGVTAIRHGQAIRAEPADVVMILDVATTGMARQALRHTRSAVKAGTAVVLLFGGDPGSTLILHTRRALLDAGCSAGRIRYAQGTTALLAERMTRATLRYA